MLLPLIERLYASALTPCGWSDAIDDVARVLGGDHALLCHAAKTWDDGMFVASAGLDDRNLERFVSWYAGMKVSPRGLAIDLYAPGRAISSADIMSDADVERSEIYNEIIRPANGFYSLTSVGPRASTFALSVCRSRPGGAFGEAQGRALETLLPHVSMALEFNHRLQVHEQQNTGWLVLMEKSRDGVILCNEEGQPTFMNRRALEIAAEGDGLMLAAKGFSAANPMAAKRLRDAITKASSKGAGQVQRLNLPRPSGRLPLAVSVTPLWRLTGSFAARNAHCIAIFIQTLDMPAQPNIAVLSDIFRLTRREAEVAALITTGATLPEIARRLDVGVGTVRSHLKQAFAKTGARNQAALVALLAACIDVWC